MSETNPKQPRVRLTLAHLTGFLVLLGLISCIGIPLFYSRPKITLDNAAFLFAKDLRYAQNEAVLASQTTSLVVDSEGDGYSILYSSGQAVSNPVGGADLTRVYSYDAIFRGVSIKALGESVAPVQFDRYGFALNGARYQLTYKSGTRLVEVAKGDGRVAIEGLEQPWEDSGL